jgi:sugar O-acyltransferase (sialic acid O-acetyltransferase NeuD family)
MGRPLVIFGTSEMASLAKFYFYHDSDYEVAGFTVDDDYLTGNSFEGLPVIPFSSVNEKYPPSEFDMHVALSYLQLNKLREKKYYQAKEAGYTLANYISSKATTWHDLSVGDNCFILEDQTIQPSVKIGNNVMLWSGNHIGHGVEIGNHTYLAAQVVISGNCKIGERCFFGVNASLKDFLTIGDDVFVGMDASVTKDLPNDSVMLGAKCNSFEPDDIIGKKIKDSYFKL